MEKYIKFFIIVLVRVYTQFVQNNFCPNDVG